MIFKESKLNYTDDLGLLSAKTIHLYKGFKRKQSKYSNVILLTPLKIKNYKNYSKKNKIKGLLVHLKYTHKFNNGNFIFFFSNNLINFKKNYSYDSKSIIGCVPYFLKKKKIIFFFKKII